MEFEDEVKEMIDCHQECDYLDFKEYDYQPSHKSELIKDILALANSHSIRNKYIIIGIAEENNVCKEIMGVDIGHIRDEAEFQQIINTYIYENLIVNYKLMKMNDKDILIIQIPASNNANRPFMVKKQIDRLKENEIYIRRGSTTGLASKKDLEYMMGSKKSSNLVLKSYQNGELSNKILLAEVKTKIEEYRKKKFDNLRDKVNKIMNLKGKKFSFNTSDFILLNNESVEFDSNKKSNIKSGLDDLGIKYDDSIFEFRNIRWQTCFGGVEIISKELYGDENEIKRYWMLDDLESYILEYMTIRYYEKKLPKIYSTNLVLSNIGNCVDEDIEVTLIIDKDVWIEMKNLMVNDDILVYLGNMYNDLKDELIDCPRVSSIDRYCLSTELQADSYVNSIDIREKTYFDKMVEKADEFKDNIENLCIESVYEENDKNIIKLNFKKIMHNKSMFFKFKFLFKSDKIKINYEIRSKNSPNVINGCIES